MIWDLSVKRRFALYVQAAASTHTNTHKGMPHTFRITTMFANLYMQTPAGIPPLLFCPVNDENLYAIFVTASTHRRSCHLSTVLHHYY